MLSVQLLNSIGDIVQNVSQFSSNLDNQVISNVKEIITKFNSPFFKYIPEVKIFHIIGLMAGVSLTYLPMDKPKEIIQKILEKYPTGSGVVVIVVGVVIFLLVV